MTTRELSWHIYGTSEYKRTIQQRGISYEILVEKSVMPEDDKGLLDAYQSGSEEAFARLVIRYQGLVHNACCRQVHSTDVEDCVQAVFIVLARRPAVAARAMSVAAWLHKVSYYICRNMRRDTQRRNVMINKLVNESVFNAYSETIDSEVLSRLDIALMQLKEAQRAAVLLHVEKNSFDEIANKLGVTKANAIKLTQRGLHALREYFTRRGMPIAESTLLLLAGANVSSASLPCISSAKVLLNYSHTKTATLLAQSVTKYVSFGLMKGIVYTVLVSLIVAAVPVIVNPDISLFNKPTSLAPSPPNNVIHVAVMPPAVTEAEITNDNQDFITYKQQAELALALKVPTYSHGYFGPNAATRLLLEKHKENQLTILKNALQPWAKFNPRQTANWTATILNREIRQEALSVCLTLWARVDPSQAMAWVETLSQEDHFHGMDAVIVQWTAQDPKGALAWLNANEHAIKRQVVIHTFIKEWAKNDATKALAWFKSQKLSAEDTSYYLHSLLRGWSEQNPQQAYAWLQKQDNYNENTSDMESVLHGWAKRDPVQLANMVHDIRNEDLKSSAIKFCVGYYAKNDPAKLFDLVTEWGIKLSSIADFVTEKENKTFIMTNDDLHKSIAYEWGKKDPEKSIQWALSITNEEVRAEALKSIVSLWAFRDPEKTVAWFNQQENKLRYIVVGSLVAGWAEKDLSGALTWSKQLDSSDIKKAIMQRDVVGLTIYGSDGTLGVDNVGKMRISERDIAIASLISTCAFSDPQTAVVLVNEIGHNTIKTNARIAIALSRAEKDPKAAIAWLAMCKLGDATNSAWTEMGTVWARWDPDKALAWAATLKLGNDEDKDWVVKKIAECWLLNNPFQASLGVMKLEDLDAKKAALVELAGGWYRYRFIPFTEVPPAPFWLEQLKPGEIRNAVLKELAKVFAGMHVQSALAWAKAQQPREAMMAALAGVAEGMALTNIEQAINLLGTIDPGVHRDETEYEIAYWYLLKDPQKATEWIATCPLTPMREKIVKYTLSQLHSQDNQIAKVGLKNLTPVLISNTTGLNELISLVKKIAASEPLEMVQWSMQINDDDLRNSLLGATASAWFKKNSTQANAWFQSLNQTTRDRILKKYPDLQKFDKPAAQDVKDF